MRDSGKDASGSDFVSEVSQTYEDGSRITLEVRKIRNGFLTKKSTFTPIPKDKKHSDATDSDYEKQHRCEEFFTVRDPRKNMSEKPLKEEKTDVFAEFVLETGLLPLERN